MVINAEIVQKAIDDTFTYKEQQIIEEVVGCSINRLINHNLLQIGVLSIDVSLMDKFITPMRGASLANCIATKYGKEAATVISKVIKSYSILDDKYIP